MSRAPSTWMTLAASTAAHGAFAALVVGHGFAAERVRPAGDVPVELVVMRDTPEEQNTEPRAEAIRSTAHPGVPSPHHHSYRVPVDHDAMPHDPNLVHVPLPVAPARPAESVDSALLVAPQPVPPVFVLGPSATLVAHGVSGEPGAPTTAIAAPGVVSERDVDVRARVLSRGSLTYPPEARRAQVEADVPVEIVVAEGGNVASARALGRAGYGLDAAAIDAVRGYRFSAARREGRPVRVRMRWVVQFRLD